MPPRSGKSTGFKTFTKNVLFTEQPEGVESGYDADFRDLPIAEAEQIRGSNELYVDHTTTYQLHKGYTLTIEHVPTGLPVTFKAILTRSEDARCNLSKVASLAQKLYPKYSGDASNVSTISNAPLLRIKFANFIRDARSGGGLLGKTNGFSFAPVLEDGFFDYPNLLYPKTINVNFTFDVLHEHVVGWGDAIDGETKFGVNAAGAVEANAFPYVRGLKIPSNTISFDEARGLDTEAAEEQRKTAELLDDLADLQNVTRRDIRRNIRESR